MTDHVGNSIQKAGDATATYDRNAHLDTAIRMNHEGKYVGTAQEKKPKLIRELTDEECLYLMQEYDCDIQDGVMLKIY